MKNYPEGITFKYPWRNYQRRVLEELSAHLYNRHLHIIAPPGSGKTVLGLEVALRLNRPTLVMAPTIAIRNQWIERFCELFLQTTTVPEWISTNIHEPGFLTVSTYQGLHAACTASFFEEEEPEEETDNPEHENEKKYKNEKFQAVAARLASIQVNTFVLDEAHHLKNSWWQTLTALKKALDPVVVALTATPPYDVSYTEWQRYTELNGPVDAEISMPELVAEGDLCPHQDYVYFSFPTNTEELAINTAREKLKLAWQSLLVNETLAKAMQQHRAWLAPEDHLEWIYSNTECYSEMLIYLNHNSVTVRPGHLDIIGDRAIKIPVPDARWMETLLNFYLFGNQKAFEKFEEHRLKLENSLRHKGATDRRKISFVKSARSETSLVSSVSKLSAIKNITDFEHGCLGSKLRMVILTDYIRKEYLSEKEANNISLDKIGVISIFEKLRRENRQNLRLGVLTGSVIKIPEHARGPFMEAAARAGVTATDFSALPYDESYILVQPSEKLKNDVVRIVTNLFESGEIEVLVGTKSLLGEGWDAPAINSLILASVVGSFVLSNQMRGRAIRAQHGNKNKTGNIWHLVCIDRDSADGGDDLAMLKRRFKAFTGLAYDPAGGIENGAARVEIPVRIFDEKVLTAKNDDTFNRAAQRHELYIRWQEALKSGIRMVEEIRIPPLIEKNAKEGSWRELKNLYYNKTIKYLVAELLTGIVVYLHSFLEILGRARVRNLEQFKVIIYSFLAGALLFFGRKLVKYFRLYTLYRDITKDVDKISQALLDALCREKCITTPQAGLKAVTSIDSDGYIYAHLEGGTTYEKSLYITALTEIVSPVNNPRYVIIRKNKKFYMTQRDYHAVPELISRTKKPAEYFAERWQYYVGDCTLVFTRNTQGRKLLLRSRRGSLAAQFQEPTEQISKWR